MSRLSRLGCIAVSLAVVLVLNGAVFEPRVFFNTNKDFRLLFVSEIDLKELESSSTVRIHFAPRKIELIQVDGSMSFSKIQERTKGRLLAEWRLGNQLEVLLVTKNQILRGNAILTNSTALQPGDLVFVDMIYN